MNWVITIDGQSDIIIRETLKGILADEVYPFISGFVGFGYGLPTLVTRDLELLNLFVFLFQRFTQYLASSSSNFQLSAFLDKGGVQGTYFGFQTD